MIKVYTEVVQTDVMVFDKQGRFVDGLKREDFELRIDGKLQPVGFFELLKASAPDEEKQLAAARGVRSNVGQTVKGPTVPLDRGRLVFFYVDDMHLAPPSLVQTRKLLLRFIDQDLKQNDEAGVISASGGLGFLQQLTDNKAVLRAAAERLTSRAGTAKDSLRPPMSEYQALQIDRGERDTLGYFVDELLRENPKLGRPIAEDEVRGRASAILNQAAYYTKTTLSSLDYLIRSCAKLPGRKLLFLISDGFLVDSRNSDSNDRLRLLISAAGRAAVVVYSIDARGLIASLTDASNPMPADTSGRLIRGGQGEISATQDALYSLARDTGGRTLFDSNDLYAAVDNGLKETSVYYLLGWGPERTGEKSSKFRRLEVAVVGRPDLIVRVRRGFFDLERRPITGKPKESAKQKRETQTPAAKLQEAIIAPNPERQIPISLALNYLDTPDKGIALSVSIQMPVEFLSLNSEGGKDSAQVDLAGAVFDQRGQSGARFGERVTLSGQTDTVKSGGRQLVHTHMIFLGPGLYQVRVAARDTKTGYLGSARAWVEVPDLSNHNLTLSSLFVGERPQSSSQDTTVGHDPVLDQLALSVDRRFTRESFLRYLFFIYNSTRSDSNPAPDVLVQTQILRDDQPVFTAPVQKIPTEAGQDLQRLPYAAEIPLERLPAGNYVLRVTAIDRLAKSSASQQARFEIH